MVEKLKVRVDLRTANLQESQDEVDEDGQKVDIQDSLKQKEDMLNTFVGKF